MDYESVLIWKANTAIRRLIKPTGGIVRIAMDEDKLRALAEEKPESYLSELSELKYDLYNQIGYAVLPHNRYAIVCARMSENGVRNTYFELRSIDKVLYIERYETIESVPSFVDEANWRNTKRDGRRK